jgi:hypothetical protein
MVAPLEGIIGVGMHLCHSRLRLRLMQPGAALAEGHYCRECRPPPHYYPEGSGIPFFGGVGAWGLIK